VTAAAGAGERPEPAAVEASGWRALAYDPPVPGTYRLPPLGDAADGAVLDERGAALAVHDLLGDKIAVLSFVYTRCPDMNACPMATYVLSGLARRASEDPAVGSRLRLLTLSFDPQRDRPAVMARFAEHLTRGAADWRFLTTASDEALAPILRGYDQSVRREYDEAGRPLGTLSHVLRVVLIDRARRIRNVYSSSFLHADTVWADVQTLLLEADAAAGTVEAPPLRSDAARPGASPAVPVADGAPGPAGDLADRLAAPPLGLPPLPDVPAGLPTPAQIALGRRLFFDRRLSHNGTISCAMCHVPAQGFTNNELATAVGLEGRTVRRNAPTLYNVAYAERLFHDAREDRLEQQVWGPLLAANEMGNPSVGYVLATLRALPAYRGRFETAFAGQGPTMETVGAALASYQRTLLSGGSPFDRWRWGGESEALSAAARRGFELFTGGAGCAGCHHVGAGAALFTDQSLHNTGVGFRATMGLSLPPDRIRLTPGTFLGIDPAVIAAASAPAPGDLGRYEVTGDPDDRWTYRTPTLRNVALTAPYMHDGSLATLRDVVEFYDRGGVPNEGLDARLRPLGLSREQVADLVAFLESLTGADVDLLVADALAAPVGDPD
jgi:cytochrome c peroxidase